MTSNKGRQSGRQQHKSSFAWFLVAATVAVILLSQFEGIA